MRHVKDYYDRIAGRYDQRWKLYVEGTLVRLKNLMMLTGSERVLDVACGTGELEIKLLGDNPGQEIVGIDISDKMLEVAGNKLRTFSGVRFVRSLASQLPFADGSFDVVVTANAYHYFNNPGRAASEMTRVVRPGGRVVIMDWCRDYLACRVFDVALSRVDKSHKECFSLSECRRLMEGAGLKVEQERRFRLRVFWGLMVVVCRRV